MEISQFTLRGIAFEIRYPNAYKLWDTAGQVWAEAAQKWPDGKMVEGQPSSTKMSIDNRVELSVKLDRSGVVSAGLKQDFEWIFPYCDFIVKQASETLKAIKLTRIGVRPTYVRRYPTIDEAVDAFVSTGFMRVPTGKHFGIDGKLKLPECVIRYEGDQLGCMAHLKVQTVTSSIQAPLGEEPVTLDESERHELVFDCDYFTKTDVLVGQLNIEQWITQAVHVIRRDSKIILGG